MLSPRPSGRSMITSPCILNLNSTSECTCVFSQCVHTCPILNTLFIALLSAFIYLTFCCV
uniref:Uncharacterized protein n=1 Tax=Anguilla anguilla TaxID=7936 RepID=A0A0E9VVN2_ANGAN